MNNINAVAAKLGPIIRLLSSSCDGEVLAAARAIGRTLKGAGLDFHALAERIEQTDGNGKISEADMQRLFNAGFVAGKAAAEDQHRHSDGFDNLDGTTTPEAMAAWCRRHSDKLGEREQKFIRSVSAQIEWREPSPKQAKWLRSIFLKTGGRL